MNAPAVSNIYVHPIKSVSRVAVPESVIMPGGGLEHDREFALFTADDVVINAKRYPRIHYLQAKYDLSAFTVGLGDERFHLIGDHARLERWFSEFFGFPVTMKRNVRTGFPDDLAAPGPTILSVGTLDEVNSWFPDLDREQVGRRFRANVEIGNVPPFWEDRLFGEPEEIVGFTIGDVRFEGINPCARCPVPSRDPDTAETLPNFQKIFSEKREATLPDWVALGRFNHFYRLSVNTRVPATEAGKRIRVGDVISHPGGVEGI